jgi:hypothetical protein
MQNRPGFRRKLDAEIARGGAFNQHRARAKEAEGVRPETARPGFPFSAAKSRDGKKPVDSIPSEFYSFSREIC